MNLGGYFIPAGTIVLRVGQVTSNDVSAEILPIKEVVAWDGFGLIPYRVDRKN